MSRLLQELKRRNVFRVAAAYLVAAWVLLQVTDLLVPTLAVESRFKVGFLNQAGLQHLAIPETSVLNYLPRVTVPVLQFNGRYDSDFRFESSARPFFELLGTNPADKKHVVENWGHFVPRNIVIGETLDWLDRYLGPAN